MKLIAEQIQDVEYIVEEKDGGSKEMKIRGIFMQSDQKNRNGRVYPFEILNKEVKRYNKEFVCAYFFKHRYHILLQAGTII